MKRRCSPLTCFLFVCVAPCLQAQLNSSPGTDPGAKANGAYSGGNVAHVDLATGNIMGTIPLASFPQLGKLPPLSFTANFSGDAFAENETCDSTLDQCWVYNERPPSLGGIYPNIGPTINSSLEGGYAHDASHLWIAAWIAIKGPPTCDPLDLTSQEDCPAYLNITLPTFDGEYFFDIDIPVTDVVQSYGFIDPTGETHTMAADASNWNTFRATDGSGYSLIGAQGSNLFNGWYGDSPLPVPGTVYGPNGVQSVTITPPNGNAVYQTTTSDPIGNSIVRSWGCCGLQQYADSVGRVIPDLSSAYFGGYSADLSKCPNLGIANQPAESSEIWTVPGISNTMESYIVCFTSVQYLTDFYGTAGNNIGGEPSVWPFIQYQQSNGDPVPPGSDPGVFSVETWDSISPIQSIVLPDGTYWSFTYDAGCLSCDLVAQAATPGWTPTYGDILQIHYPTGATESFTYQNMSLGIGPSDTPFVPLMSRVVKTVTTNDGVGNTVTKSFDYAPGSATNVPGSITTEHDPIDGDYPNTYDTVHTFTNYGTDIFHGEPSFFETEVDYYAGAANNSPLLQKIQTQYQSQPEIQPIVTNDSYLRPTNVLPISITTSTPAGTQSVEYPGYESLFTAINVVCQGPEASACGQGANPANGGQSTGSNISFSEPISDTITDGSGNILRQTVTTPYFVGNSSYYAANFLTLPGTTRIYGQPCVGTSGNPCTLAAQTTYRYDENNGSPQGIYGEQTSVTRTVNTDTGSAMVSTSTAYNSIGMPSITKDENLNQTYVQYASSCGGLFPQSITKAYQSTSTTPETSNYSFDCNTGAVNSATDPNGVTTQFTYNTTPATSYQNPVYGFGRLQKVASGAATPLENWTQYSYPSATEIDSATDQDQKGDGKITKKVIADGLLRSIQMVNPDGSNVVTSYTSAGEVAVVTNPYFATVNGSTSFTYDALGRKTIQVQPDNTTASPRVLQWCYDNISSSGQTNCHTNLSGMAGNWVDSADESGTNWQSISNSLGQLSAVVEPGGLNTSYSYDNLGNLNQVTQAGNANAGDASRTRLFLYDSLSRLTFACNPEALPQGSSCDGNHWSTSYTYEANGNLHAKTDARNVTTNYTYDALNRILTKTFTGDPAGTLSSCYQYDAISAFGLGRIAASWRQAGSCAPSPPSTGIQISSQVLAFDEFGRVKKEQQCTPGNCTVSTTSPYTLNYGYDLAGDLTYNNDGIGQAGWTHQYDILGRLSSTFAHTLWPTSLYPANLFSAQTYQPVGGLSAWTMGTSTSSGPALTGSRTYDLRQRPISESVTGHD